MWQSKRRRAVVGGLVKAFKDYEQKNEAAWHG
jgi:hypothetical protein